MRKEEGESVVRESRGRGTVVESRRSKEARRKVRKLLHPQELLFGSR